jgi:hypothetical protein
MSTRTDALVSQQETGKITASIIPIMSGCHPALESQLNRPVEVPHDTSASQAACVKGHKVDFVSLISHMTWSRSWVSGSQGDLAAGPTLSQQAKYMSLPLMRSHTE